MPALADGSNHESWYARSRSRLATGLLLTAPGIPQIFMGQEFLEDKQWSWDPTSSNLIWWAGLNPGTDTARADHLRFTHDLIRLRWNYPALRGDDVNPFHVHEENRVIAFHRWLEGTGAQPPGMAQPVCPPDDEARTENRQGRHGAETGGSHVLDDAQGMGFWKVHKVRFAGSKSEKRLEWR
jgi:1,4-alpha-glucan branching enzyme